ncbi:hypothetical protein B0A48_04935 [Cryoendolithus antarcticus]|uniref:Uncharacterized protein n=1 Tax=Cryoendolithus antarcticus TaxID=1507870 RepID=A0A1V8TDS9_9PEZI|nr:hypothetical protein B0A48_04935 [Cryoendolithus antarcticus]
MPDEGLGIFALLPPELRATIWQHAMAPYRQHFVRLRYDGDYVLDALQMPVPLVYNISATIRAEVHDLVYTDRSCMIIVHPGGAWADFPLVLCGNPSSLLDSSKARIPVCRSLNVGIELPTPRQIGPIAAGRGNVRRIVDLLNKIARQQRISPIRIYLHTPPSRRDRVYRRSDFEVVVGPFHALRLPVNPAPQPILISRNFCWYQTDHGRDDSCNLIETAVRQFQDQTTAVTTKRQLTIDIKLNLSLVSHGLCAAIPADFIIGKVCETATQLQAWYAKTYNKQPDWLLTLAWEIRRDVGDGDGLLQRMIDAAVGNQLGEATAHHVLQWSNGHMARVNPYWDE